MTPMEGGYRKIRVFVASPADVAAERDILASVINELNTTIAALIPDSKVVGSTPACD
jgi:hypothetical protein